MQKEELLQQLSLEDRSDKLIILINFAIEQRVIEARGYINMIIEEGLFDKDLAVVVARYYAMLTKEKGLYTDFSILNHLTEIYDLDYSFHVW